MKSVFRPSCLFRASLLTLCATASAATFTFDTDPFALSTAPTTHGRQIVGGEPFINFVLGTDAFAFAPSVFGIVGSINFANNVVGSLPTSGVNAIVLRTFDDDANPATPFGAGNAANLIAAQLTSPGAGFFVYFNQGLDLARLVYSTDLSENTSDLKILARLTNLSGQAGRDAFPTFSAANFQTAPVTVPDSASALTLIFAAAALFAGHRYFRRNDSRG